MIGFKYCFIRFENIIASLQYFSRHKNLIGLRSEHFSIVMFRFTFLASTFFHNGRNDSITSSYIADLKIVVCSKKSTCMYENIGSEGSIFTVQTTNLLRLLNFVKFEFKCGKSENFVTCKRGQIAASLYSGSPINFCSNSDDGGQLVGSFIILNLEYNKSETIGFDFLVYWTSTGDLFVCI